MNNTDLIKESYYMLGKRVQLISTTDQYTSLTYGDLGTINYIDDIGTVFISWDNGSNLGLVPGVDRWKIIHD